MNFTDVKERLLCGGGALGPCLRLLSPPGTGANAFSPAHCPAAQIVTFLWKVRATGGIKSSRTKVKK